ncbi:tRNA adenosine(34) deaminase TadA [Collinsella sp. AGMB00827]|uniref:tRNA-specific adenosine deaminase n=1 Tax=Collinsella ureilytica TaxID=2869515 RepID=A0ABS7MLD2_9ACTN|nr:tRNA adenosine(34) deaminase TadA [Collinsella urealyticum]MBY4797858.1 tRNA adenosine(34) deaminase TadA [Collinsella urealyticum]
MGRLTTDEHFMREALVEARLAAAEGEVPVGAVVVAGGSIVARGHNTREQDADPSAHAEFSALIAAAHTLGRWRLEDCTVYVTLEPCPMCAGLMLNARVGRCVFGAADPKAGATGSLLKLHHDPRLNHHFEVSGGVLGNECAQELQAFFTERRRGRASVSLGDRAHDAAQAGASCACASQVDVLQAGVAQGGSSSGDALQADASQVDAPQAAATRDGSSYDAAMQTDAFQVGAARVSSSYGDAPHASTSQVCALQNGASQAAQQVGAGLRVLIAPDSFKGSATSYQAGAWIAAGVRRVAPAAELVSLHLADGGEGTVDALSSAFAGDLHTCTVNDPLSRPIQARYLLSGEVAVIESASAAGFCMTDGSDEQARRASSYGVGELLRAAITAGAKTVYVGLGGTCTNDCGSGLLQALGAHILNVEGRPITPGLAGLAEAASVDLQPALEAVSGVRILALSDVNNPLVGARGALAVFGPQKGLKDPASHDATFIRFAQLLDAARQGGACANLADESDAACKVDAHAGGSEGASTLDREAQDDVHEASADMTQAFTRDGNLPRHTNANIYAQPRKPRTFRAVAAVPGAGAAGGLGAALLALGGEIVFGADAVLDALQFDEVCRAADLVITGEGHIDDQTKSGKAVLALAHRAQKLGRPVIALVGGRAQELGSVYAAGVGLVLPVLLEPMDLRTAMQEDAVRTNLICAGETAMKAFLLR